MTATPQPESKSPSRRALLAGALGGIGAWAASAIGSPPRTQAHDVDDVRLGGANLATTPTEIVNATTAATVLSVLSDSGIAVSGDSDLNFGVAGYSNSAFGVYGHSNSSYGVYGNSASSRGVFGNSGSGPGVYGSSSSNIGVGGFSVSNTAVYGNSDESVGLYGDSSATGQPASIGRSLGNSTGVQGYSGTGSPPAAKARTGVYGYAAQSASSQGVWGHSPAGNGVVGSTTTGYAGYFSGKVYSTQFYELSEIGTPAAPVSNRARLFVKDNGAGKTQLCVRFHTGAVKVLTTEP